MGRWALWLALITLAAACGSGDEGRDSVAGSPATPEPGGDGDGDGDGDLEPAAGAEPAAPAEDPHPADPPMDDGANKGDPQPATDPSQDPPTADPSATDPADMQPTDPMDPIDPVGPMDPMLPDPMLPVDPVDPLDPTLDRDAFCNGGGPVVTVPGVGGGNVCAPNLARELFSHSLCTCENTAFAGYLVTRSFSASTAPIPVAAGAPVGINGQLISGSYVDVGGTLQVYGASVFAGFLEVGGDLFLHSPLALPGYLEVARDVWLEDDALVAATTIGRDLYTQPGKIEPPLWAIVGGSRVQTTFSVDEPCACAEDELLDVTSIVADGQATNDNADPAVNLDPASLVGHVGYRRIELPCGRFYVDAITGIGDITLVVNGRTALFVGGDVSTIGKFDIELGPDGELDLFIAGDLNQIGYGTFGDPARPSRVRVYVGGDGDILFLGYQPVGANIYAPRSRLWSDGYVDMSGSLFVRELDAGAYIDIAYDRDIIDLDDDACNPPEDELPPDDPPPDDPPPDDPPPPPPPECTDACDASCSGNITCIDGECAPCVTDADCCEPLVCFEDGRCGPLLF